jgi:hypothetical protein
MVGEGRADCVHLCDIVIHGSVNNGLTELAVLVEDQVATSPQSKGISVQSADGVGQARNRITTAVIRPSGVRACIDPSPLGADEAAKEVLPANESLAAKRVVNGGSVPSRPIANHDRPNHLVQLSIVGQHEKVQMFRGSSSKGANPHTRSIYEKKYLRYSVFFFRYS